MSSGITGNGYVLGPAHNADTICRVLQPHCEDHGGEVESNRQCVGTMINVVPMRQKAGKTPWSRPPALNNTLQGRYND